MHATKNLQACVYCNHDWDSMSCLITSAHESFQCLLFMVNAFFWFFMGAFSIHFYAFSEWKDAICPLPSLWSRAETHKRCWSRGVHLGFRIPSLGSSLLWTHVAAQKQFKKHTVYLDPGYMDLVGGGDLSITGKPLWICSLIPWCAVNRHQSTGVWC